MAHDQRTTVGCQARHKAWKTRDNMSVGVCGRENSATHRRGRCLGILLLYDFAASVVEKDDTEHKVARRRSTRGTIYPVRTSMSRLRVVNGILTVQEHIAAPRRMLCAMTASRKER